MRLLLKNDLPDEGRRPAAANILRQQARFDEFASEFDDERPHKALVMRGNDVAPPTGLAGVSAKFKATRIADLSLRKTALLARREIIAPDISLLAAKLNELQERPD